MGEVKITDDEAITRCILAHNNTDLMKQATDYIIRLKAERDDYEKLAKSWMQDYDKLKAKYEPSVLVY